LWVFFFWNKPEGKRTQFDIPSSAPNETDHFDTKVSDWSVLFFEY